MKSFFALTVLVFSGFLAQANDLAFDATITVLLSNRPQRDVQCGDQTFKIGGSKINSNNLVYGMKETPIDCKRTGIRSKECSFKASRQNDDLSISTYLVTFSITRNNQPEEGPFVNIEGDELNCVKLP